MPLSGIKALAFDTGGTVSSVTGPPSPTRIDAARFSA